MKNNINALRKARGMTWEELAAATGISVSSLHRYAYGPAQSINCQYADALCTVFGLPLGRVFEAEIVDLPLSDE